MNFTKKQIITIVVILGILVISISTFAFVSNQKISNANLAQLNISSSSSSTSSKTTKDNSSQVQVINPSSSLISSSSYISSQVITAVSIIPAVLSSSSSAQTQSSSQPLNQSIQAQVLFLDSNNPPQYLKEYLNCQTKDLKNSNGKITHYGQFIKQNALINYKCPPSLKSQSCQNSITWIDYKPKSIGIINSEGAYTSPYQKGWNCDLWNPVSFIPGFGDPCIGNNSERVITPDGFYQERIDGATCMFYFPNQKNYKEDVMSNQISELTKTLNNQKTPITKLIILK